ncbi:NAD(P)/FAD-dependent oxidoreductase [Flavihumibacter profundi]|jgi:D-amino-acid dehydrogenase|uniref:NAD(P)/FAD-dependent oxidoreductase n=1 Tax=Flavihumibacter profundi TaxID=2716883 RepID=UPI001CC4C3AD|nr:FAD-dependent oxidoreductase [Flavihumibacter profundi]MBZ5858902.1 FAD-dependent oxidoreductase [Flavihumibacter profundi]
MKAVIIGGGIIGLCSAYYLAEAGWDVTIIDRTDLADNCSYGNLGMIVPSHFVPLAAPGIISQGIRWMFDAKSPFYVKPSLSWNLVSWGLKFMQSATKAKAEAAAPYLRDINLLSRSLYEELKSLPGFDFAYERKGIMMYFKDPKVGEEEAHLAEKARSMGLDVDTLGRQAAQQLEPAVTLDVLGAVHYKCDAHLYPNKLNQQLLQHLQARGVRVITGTEITRIDSKQGKVSAVQTETQTIGADLFILAAGSWLPELLKKCGQQIPLMPGKGYSFTLDHPQKSLNIPAILCEARVAITPMAGKMRYGGTMELGPVNHSKNMNRVRGIVESIPAYFPGLQVAMPAEQDVWYGFRPCSPDGLPYIGYIKSLDNLIVAGGHAMMGLSLGPATGKLVAELASRKKTSVSIEAFDPNRF